MEETADLYAVLGVSPGASGDEIRDAYRRLARQHHPDTLATASPEELQDAAEQMLGINAAWEILGSPERRERYDRERRGAIDPLRLANAEAVLGPGFALSLPSGGMTVDSWGAHRLNPFHPGTGTIPQGPQWLLTTWARDLSPLRRLYPNEVYGLAIVNGRETDDSALDHVGALHWLEVLDLESTAVTDAGVAKLGQLKSLWSLNLARTDIADGALPTLASLRALRELNLAETGVTDAAIPYLMQLERLSVLNLRRTRVTPTPAAKQLAELPHLHLLAMPRGMPMAERLRLQWRHRERHLHLA